MPPNHIVVDLPDGALVVAPYGDGVYASFGSSIYNVTVTNGVGARIYAGDDGIEINTSAATATGAMIIDNSGIIVSSFSAATETGRAINIDLPLVAPGSVTIINHETGHLQGSLGEAIVITGDSADTITNEGIIIGSVETGGGNDTFNLFTGSAISGLIDGEAGIDTINLAGSGSGTLQNFSNIEVISVNEGAWTVDLENGSQTVRLANAVIADGSFDGAINNLGAGDRINLVGIGLATSATLGPDNLLTISGGAGGPVTVQLDPLQDFSGQVFQLIDDGAGGTNVLLASTGTIDITGGITTPGIGILITISPDDPGASWTITNSGIIDTGDDNLQVIADPAVVAATGTFIVDNSGTMTSASGHAVNFNLPLTSPGSVNVINRASGLMEVASGDAIVISGDTDDTITNEGTIIGGVSTGLGDDTLNLVTGSSISGTVNGGSGLDTINLAGSGPGTLENFTGIEVINVNEGAWTVDLQSGSQTVRLANAVIADGSFDGAINNLGAGDTINLAGIGLATSLALGPSNLLTISGGTGGPVTVQLDPLQDFSGQVFQLIDDGAGGTDVLLASTGTIDITGTVTTPGIGVLIIVGADDPGASWTLTNSGTIDTGDDNLQVIADPAVVAATGTFIVDNSGTMTSATGRAVNFDLPLAAPGSVTVINRATGLMQVASGDAIVISGDTDDTITNEGTIIGGVSTGLGDDTLNLATGSTITELVNGGLGTDVINLNGSGLGELESFAGIEIINVNQGTWTLGSEGVAAANFQSGSQTMRLANGVISDGSFTGTINNFASGDLIGLAGIGLATSAILGAGNLLTVEGGSGGPITLQLDPLQDFSGMVFALTSDGAGGTNIALAPAPSGGGEVIGGTEGSDTVSSGSGNDSVVSGEGDDNVSTGGGNDFIQAGNGNSNLSGESGDDTIVAGDGNNNVNGGSGNDAVTVGDGNNNLSTASGDDSVTAGDGNNNIASGGGDDHVTLGNGVNAVNTDSGNDTVVAGDGDNSINTGGGDDEVAAGDGDNNLNTGSGHDEIIAGDGDNTINTGSGNDEVAVGDGHNNVNGGSGSDAFHVGSGENSLTGSSGADTFYFADDFGNTVITDFAGADTIVFDGVFADFDAMLDFTDQVGSDVVISLNPDQSVTLADLSLSELNADDFVFT